MLCSDCSKIVHPVVAVDIDGTLGDYHGHFLWFAIEYFGMDDGNFESYKYTGVGSFKQWWMDAYQRSEKDWHDVKLAYRQGGMKRTMPIFEDAQELCWTIKELGADLWLTTTRPYLSLDNVIPDTVEWCRRHGIEYDGMLFDEDKYIQLAERVDDRRVVAVFDDLVEMCNAAAKALHFGYDVPVLVSNPYNEDVVWSSMASLAEAVQIVGDRIDWWKEEYAA